MSKLLDTARGLADKAKAKLGTYPAWRVALVAVAVGILLALVMCTSASAGEDARSQDRWTGQDKVLHFGGEMAIGGALRAAMPERPKTSFALCMVPGVAKEFSDRRQRGNYFSPKDLAADALGCAAGVLGMGFILRYSKTHGTQVVYQRELH